MCSTSCPRHLYVLTVKSSVNTETRGVGEGGTDSNTFEAIAICFNLIVCSFVFVLFTLLVRLHGNAYQSLFTDTYIYIYIYIYIFLSRFPFVCSIIFWNVCDSSRRTRAKGSPASGDYGVGCHLSRPTYTPMPILSCPQFPSVRLLPRFGIISREMNITFCFKSTFFRKIF